MTHKENIKTLIDPVKETKVLPKFLHWILTDPKYGTINNTNDKKSIESIQGVIDLYKEWIDTGIKPSEDLWLKAREFASAAAAADWAAYAAVAADWAAYAAFGIPRSEVEKAQIDKLESLIKNKGEEDDGCYTWEDYETIEEN